MTDISDKSKLDTLIAKNEIYEAVCRYMRGQDRLLPELQRSSFHDDAIVDCGIFCGNPDEYVNFAQSFLKATKASHHMIGQVDLSVDGCVATGEVYFIAQHRIVEDDQDKDLFVAGRYKDRYEKKNGEWKISNRREVVDWVRTDAASDQSFLKSDGIWFGARGTEG